MGADPSAKLFYGIIKPLEEYEDGGPRSWGDAYAFQPIDHDEPCTIELFGADSCLRYAIAIKESVLRVEWNDSKDVNPSSLAYGDGWDTRLSDFAKRKGLDISGLEPGWYLVSLYF